MNTIDLTLFEDNPIEVKTKNKTYCINKVSAALELKLMNYQNEISEKMSNWSKLETQDLDKWKDLIKKMIKENKDNELNDEDINSLHPEQILALMVGLLKFLNKRSEIIFKSLDSDLQKEIEDAKDEVKKKALANL